MYNIFQPTKDAILLREARAQSNDKQFSNSKKIGELD